MTGNDQRMLAYFKMIGERLIEQSEHREAIIEAYSAQFHRSIPLAHAHNMADALVPRVNVSRSPKEVEILMAYARGDDIIAHLLSLE